MKPYRYAAQAMTFDGQTYDVSGTVNASTLRVACGRASGEMEAQIRRARTKAYHRPSSVVWARVTVEEIKSGGQTP